MQDLRYRALLDPVLVFDRSSRRHANPPSLLDRRRPDRLVQSSETVKTGAEDGRHPFLDGDGEEQIASAQGDDE